MSQFSRRLVFPLLAILPPTLIALATEDVGILVRIIINSNKNNDSNINNR